MAAVLSIRFERGETSLTILTDEANIISILSEPAPTTSSDVGVSLPRKEAIR